MEDRIEELRRIYMESGEHCRTLGELSRQAAGPERDKLEEVRQAFAKARLLAWAQMQKEVVREWCDATETPEPFSRYPPKDMPKRQE